MSSTTSTAAPTGGDGVSFDELYRSCADDAWRLARSVTGNDHDASDAVADAVARVYEAVASGRVTGIEVFRPYLLTATRNAAVDILRRSARTRPSSDADRFDAMALTADPSDHAVADEESAVVARAFTELPRRWQSVLWLTEVEALPPREAADVLGLSPNNVSQLAVRARDRLRERYLQCHVAAGAPPECRSTVEHLGAYAAGRLSRRRAAAVAAHLDGCAACRGRVDQLDDLGLILRRAALPFPVLLAGDRLGWGDRIARRRTARDAGRPSSAPSAAGQVVPRLDRSVVDMAQRVLSSPLTQGIAAVAVAAALVAAIAGVVNDDPPAGRAQPQAAVVSAAAPADPPPTTLAPTTVPTTVPPTEPVAPGPPLDATPTTAITPPVARPVPPPLVVGPRTSTVAEAVVPVVAVSDAPGGDPTVGLANPQPSGAPLVLLVQEQEGDWLNVLLPVRPNGSTGWVHRSEVTLMTHAFQMVVELEAHRITVYDGAEVLLSEPIGVGTSDAPTPGGLYYTTALVRPADAAGQYDPGGPYGPYAYPLSGFSEVLFDFAGGDGRLGIHGTNDPSSLGHDVSHGCIRMSNDGITQLAGILPLGVPVVVVG